jgi:hypothetical protein
MTRYQFQSWTKKQRVAARAREAGGFGMDKRRACYHEILQFEEQLNTMAQNVISELSWLIDQVHRQSSKYMGREIS